MIKLYFGKRGNGKVEVFAGTVIDAETLKESSCQNIFAVPLPHVKKHSPTGFEWGYLGSGPADLALSILCNFTENRAIAEKHYQRFKSEIIARLPKGEWAITGVAIEKWLSGKEK